MKYAVLIVILMGCGLVYIHAQQPDLWNQLVKTVGLPNLAVASDTPAQSDIPSTGTPSAPTPSDQPEIITPSSTKYVNPDHVHQVEQPPQPSASTNQGSSSPAQ